jgi:NAD(P)-dependent dehydrogenase (short-subunit alcohol dehydrogenase family)
MSLRESLDPPEACSYYGVMAGRVLITGKTTKLGTLLVDTYLSRGWEVVATVRQDEGPQEESEIDANLLITTWNRRSPLAAKNVLLSGINRFGDINEAVVIFPMDGENRPLHELPSAAIEASIDGQIKSQLFMIKEVLSWFQRKKRGQLSLVRYDEGADILPPLDAICSGTFHSLSRSLFTFYQNEELRINSFESDTSDTKAFVSFIMKNLDEKARGNHGKFYRYNDRGVLRNIGKPFRK